MRFNLEKVIQEESICSNSIGIEKNVAAILVSVLSLETIMEPISIFNRKGSYDSYRMSHIKSFDSKPHLYRTSTLPEPSKNRMLILFSSYGALVGGTGNSWGWELNSNRIYNAGEIILPVCNLERPAVDSDSTLSEKFDETDKAEFNIDEVFDEQNELNKLYHYPNSRNFSKFQEKFKCPSEFYMSKYI